jgi:hypothetical protein
MGMLGSIFIPASDRLLVFLPRSIRNTSCETSEHCVSWYGSPRDSGLYGDGMPFSRDPSRKMMLEEG